MKLLRYRRAEFQPNHGQMVALLQQLLHLAAKILFAVLKFFIIKADIRVARYRQNTAFLHIVGVKQSRQPAQQNVFGAHKALLPRKHQIGRRIVRHRHNTQRPAALFVFQQSRRVKPLIHQMRHRMVGPYENGRKHRQQIGFEKTVHLLELVGLQCLRQGILYAALGKLLHHRCADLLFHGKQARHRTVNMVQLLRRGLAGFVVRFIGCHAGKIKQTAHTHHEKFIQIVGKNRNKLEPLQGRHRGIGRFLQHALVKAQPA